MLGPIFGLWLLNEYRHQRREKAAFRHVLRCSACSFQFEDRSEVLLPRCPHCGSLNERFKLSRL
jgi:rubrerythrin